MQNRYECHYINKDWHLCMKEMRKIVKILDNKGFVVSVPIDGRVIAESKKFNISITLTTSSSALIKEYSLNDSEGIKEKRILISEEEGVVILSGKDVLGQVK